MSPSSFSSLALHFPFFLLDCSHAESRMEDLVRDTGQLCSRRIRRMGLRFGFASGVHLLLLLLLLPLTFSCRNVALRPTFVPCPHLGHFLSIHFSSSSPFNRLFFLSPHPSIQPSTPPTTSPPSPSSLHRSQPLSSLTTPSFDIASSLALLYF